jgi:DNA-binding winged helix-turn-helix (wHTH) protein/TolB-like protein
MRCNHANSSVRTIDVALVAGMDRIYRFGVFRFDAQTLDLQRDGQSVRLQRQPAQVLAVLIANAGRLVTRDELCHAVWGTDTFVDFDRGLNFCIAQIRMALSDDAGTPRYVRTVPKKGYEFICPVEVVESVGTHALAGAEHGRAPHRAAAWTPARRRWTAVAVVAVIIGVALVAYFRGSSRSNRPIVAVARFDNETGDPALTRFSDYLTDTLVEQLTETSGGSFDVIGNAAILRGARVNRDLRAIGASLHASYIVLGQVQRDTGRVRVLGHLIRLPDQTHVSVARFEDVRDQTLARTSEIAASITQQFAPRLKSP